MTTFGGGVFGHGLKFKAFHDEVLQSKPLGYWWMIEGSGTSAEDKVGALNGTYSSVTLRGRALPSVVGGKAPTFVPASSSLMTIPDNNIWDFTASFAIEALVWKRVAGTGGAIAVKADVASAGEQQWGVRVDTDDLLVFIGSTTAFSFWRQHTTGAGTVPYAQWVHVVAQWDDGSTTFEVWINGTKYTGTTSASGTRATTGPYGIGVGRYPTSASAIWDGEIGHVAIYDRALDDTEVALHFAATGI